MEWKRKTKFGCAVLWVGAFGLAAFAPKPAQAQNSIFDYLTQALSKVVAQATIMNLASYDYVSGNSLFGVYLSKGGSQGLNMHFEQGVSYVILGAGDNDILDLDLSLLSPSGTELLKDADEDATPILQFTPTYSGKRTVRITNYNSYRDGFCVMVILRQSNTGNFSLYQIAEALNNVIANSRVTSLFSSRFADGTFCLFGGRLSEGEDTYLYNTQPSSGEYALLAAGSNNVSDVDLTVIRQNGKDYTYGNEIAKDTASDNTPICSFTVHSGGYYLMKHKNYASYVNTPGFVFSVLLEM
ncbi:MAG: hypothetical protein AAB354_13015 [candidate division KSB1 bacterium]